MNAHSTLWYFHTLIVTERHPNNSKHATLNTDTPTRVSNMTPANIITWHYIYIFNTSQQHNLEHQTLTMFRPLANIYFFSYKHYFQTSPTKTVIHYKEAKWTKFTEENEVAFKYVGKPTHSHSANTTLANIILHAGKHHIPKCQMHKACKLLSGHIRRKINTTWPKNKHYPKLSEITFLIQQHKILREHLKK